MTPRCDLDCIRHRYFAVLYALVERAVILPLSGDVGADLEKWALEAEDTLAVLRRLR